MLTRRWRRRQSRQKGRRKGGGVAKKKKVKIQVSKQEAADLAAKKSKPNTVKALGKEGYRAYLQADYEKKKESSSAAAAHVGVCAGEHRGGNIHGARSPRAPIQPEQAGRPPCGANGRHRCESGDAGRASPSAGARTAFAESRGRGCRGQVVPRGFGGAQDGRPAPHDDVRAGAFGRREPTPCPGGPGLPCGCPSRAMAWRRDAGKATRRGEGGCAQPQPSGNAASCCLAL